MAKVNKKQDGANNVNRPVFCRLYLSATKRTEQPKQVYWP